MTKEEELQAALLDAYEHTKQKVGYTARRFKPMLARHGALETARRLLKPHKGGTAQTGFDKIVAAGHEELTVEWIVQQPQFRGLFTRDQLAEARRRLAQTVPADIALIAQKLNESCEGRPIGTLQSQRAKRGGLTRTSKLFTGHSIHERYAFHAGGRTELQFNIGIHKTNEDELFRQGIAFSLQRSQALPSIDPLLPKIEKFNEYLRYNPGAFSDFGMYYGERRSEFRSDIYTPTIITPEKVHEGVFIFMGTFAPLDQIDIDWILDDFDRLMPLYEYVEGTEKFPRTARREKSGFSFTPGNAARKTQSSYQRKAASVDKELRHTLIQNALFKYLESLHGEDNTSGEQNTGNGTLIDVAVRTKHGHEYYEIKTALSAQGCIREALGQLMEYAFWPGAQEAQKLIVVGEPPCDKEAETYLRAIRSRFGLPLHYRQFNLKKSTLI
ncbi:MAG: hypothetical protein Hals2KO_19530 [Halioglobus sp.]